jgi:hypothetical protein
MHQDSAGQTHHVGALDESSRQGDAVTVYGLPPLLEEEDMPPAYLALDLVAANVSFSAEILVAGDEWVLTLRDDRGNVVGSPVFFETQAGAILGAMLGTLTQVERRSG